MKKYFLLVFLFTMTFLGCLGSTASAESTGELKISYIGDTIFSFSEENQEEKLLFEVENTGSYTIPKGKLELKLGGLDPKDYGIRSLHKTSEENLSKAETFDGELFPAETQEYFWNFSPQYDILGDKTIPFQLSSCYQYVNAPKIEYCNVENNRKESEICSPTGEKDYSNTKGPIWITSVNQNPISKITSEITITISNLGNGDVYLNNPELCKKTEKNKLTLYVDLKKEFCKEKKNCITCKGLINKKENTNKATEIGDLRISKDIGKAQVTCRVNNPEQLDVEKTIQLLIDYNYETKQQHTITLLGSE